MALRARTHQGQTTPADAQEAAVPFRELTLSTMIEKQCTRLYIGDQTGIFLFYTFWETIIARGSKTVWIKCGNKDKVRATAIWLGDPVGNKYAPFSCIQEHTS
ncbi:hypothetical protein JG687_00016284 [Phytophthora cactorum]|uniref:Uncharacterized protein n=1 Tax=Phytophthora cactorum TaxID=29920 RepID=A0A8T1TWF3_9STRA|nr:hypothetical protein JG687_00016284 [Phytophthora cactorum]